MIGIRKIKKYDRNMIEVLEDTAGAVFSEGIRQHLHHAFLGAAAKAQPQAMRDFIQVEAATYWHRPGYGMEDMAGRAMRVIHERQNQSTPFTKAEEMQLAIAHEAAFYMLSSHEEIETPLSP